MNDLVVLTPDSLSALVYEAVRRALTEQVETPSPRWLTAAEAATAIGTTVDGVYKLTQRTDIPHSRIGKKLVFDRRELDDWIRGT